MQAKERELKYQAKQIFISCIVPVLNEEALIEKFIQQLECTLKALTNEFEILIIDDGSRDKTLTKVQQLVSSHVKLLGFSRNFGKEIALTAGIDHCQGDIAIIMDADFQHPLEMLKQFVEKWIEGNDIVFGVRTSRGSESYLKRNFARLFYWMMQRITNVELPTNASDFCLLDKKVIQALRQFPERSRFMKGLYAWAGYQKVGIPFTVHERIAGKSGWNFLKLTELAVTGITCFSNVPLRVWSVIGSVLSLASLIGLIFIAIVALINGEALPMFPTLAIVIIFFGGIQLLSIGILGEYIARILIEVKRRPKYLLAVKEGFDE